MTFKELSGKFGVVGYAYPVRLEKDIADYVTNLQNAEKVLKLTMDLLRSFKDNFDCDSDAHRYNTECRCCAAEKLLLKLESK